MVIVFHISRRTIQTTFSLIKIVVDTQTVTLVVSILWWRCYLQSKRHQTDQCTKSQFRN